MDNIVDKLQFAGELSESMTRVGIFAKAYDKAYADYIKQGYSTEEADRQAKMEASGVSRESMDFQRMGSDIKTVNSTVAFFNASIQDMDNTYRNSGLQDLVSYYRTGNKQAFEDGKNDAII